MRQRTHLSFGRNSMQILNHAWALVKKQWLIIIYVLLTLFLMPPELPIAQKGLFLAYSVCILLIILMIWKSKNNKTTTNAKQKLFNKRFFTILLVIAILFIIVTRLIPFVKFGEAPLGYDTGFYVWRFGINATTIVDSAPFYLNLIPYTLLGLTPLDTLHFTYFISQLLIAGGLYALLRATKLKYNFALASIVVFLFAISSTQFQAYYWMFGQQMLAMGLLLITLALLLRKSFFAILTAVLGILIHPPTFIILVLATFVFLIIYFLRVLRKKEKLNPKILYALAISLSIAIIVVILRAEHFWNLFNLYILEYKGLATNFPFWQIHKMKGLFISPESYNLHAFLLFPFALFTFLKPKAWLNFVSSKMPQNIINGLIFAYIILIGLFILISFPFIYQHRFIIIFDLFLLIFAAPTLLLLIKHFLQDKMGRLLLMIFLIICFTKTGMIVQAQQPEIYPDELKEIQALDAKVEPTARIIATSSIYTPWVVGFSQRTAFGPGINFDLWDLDNWKTFWFSEDDQARLELLEMYKYPLYLFVGSKQTADTAFYDFIHNEIYFTEISPHIFKYNSDYDQQ